jgi:hypothetical protein
MAGPLVVYPSYEFLEKELTKAAATQRKVMLDCCLFVNHLLTFTSLD